MSYIFNKNSIYIYIPIIFALSLIPSTPFIGEIQRFGFDKIVHFVEYFILGIMVHFFIKSRTKIFKIMYILIVLVPIFDEYLIQRISGRTIDGWDFLFNI